MVCVCACSFGGKLLKCLIKLACSSFEGMYVGNEELLSKLVTLKTGYLSVTTLFIGFHIYFNNSSVIKSWNVCVCVMMDNSLVPIIINL